MTAYYNEIDPFAADWLRQLIKAGHIADGTVDERSIEDVEPGEIEEFTQCHFFAGIGVWSYALRQACWPDDRPVWTGSCPCQPFSAAGKGKGIADERHLWPAFHWLIRQCRPECVFGEQVAGKNGLAWLDIVSVDLEGEGYACGSAVAAACGFGAPHQTTRLYWVADNQGGGFDRRRRASGQDRAEAADYCKHGSMADDNGHGCEQTRRGVPPSRSDGAERNGAAGGVDNGCCDGRQSRRGNYEEHERIEPAATGEADRLDNPAGPRHARKIEESEGEARDEARMRLPDSGCAGCVLANAKRKGSQGRIQGRQDQEREDKHGCAGCGSAVMRPRQTNGFWRDADWLFCRDGKWRPTQSLDESLADGLASRLGYCRIGDRYSLNPLIEKAENRVGRLRGYGNAIVLQQAMAFIESFMELHK